MPVSGSMSYPAFLTKKFVRMQGVPKMVAETYPSTLSKPFSGQRSRRANYAASDRVLFVLKIKNRGNKLQIKDL